MIVLEGVRKRYRGATNDALRNISLNVGRGMFGLLGPNGAGKSTLLNILATVLSPSDGRVEIAGIDMLRRPDDVRAIIGYAPQEFGFYPSFTVREILDYFALLDGMRVGRPAAIGRVLEQVNLADKASARIRTLSGGMKHRLAVAQALLSDPQVLLLDEPTSGLDPMERVRLKALLATLATTRTLILSSHIVSDIEEICSTVGVLHRGRLAFSGPVSALAATTINMVWSINIELPELPAIARNYIVTSSVPMDSRLQLRVVSAKPPRPDAIACPPTLEDGYLYLVGTIN